MRKIPTLFVRDPEDMRHVTRYVTHGCEWVLHGEGVATRKYDGTCVLFHDEQWWARREVKPGKEPPPNFVAIETDPNTGKTVGWEPIEQSPFVKFWREAVEGERWEPTTYELCGPKINGNPEGFERHELIQHRDAKRYEIVADADVIRATVVALAKDGVEGIVWHHPDGRMAKLKGRDLQ